MTQHSGAIDLVSGGNVFMRDCHVGGGQELLASVTGVRAFYAWDTTFIDGWSSASSAGVEISNYCQSCAFQGSLNIGSLATLKSIGGRYNSVNVTGTGGTQETIIEGVFETGTTTVSCTQDAGVSIINSGDGNAGLVVTRVKATRVEGAWAGCTMSGVPVAHRIFKGSCGGAGSGMDFTGPGRLEAVNTTGSFGAHVILRGDSIFADLGLKAGRIEAIGVSHSVVVANFESGAGGYYTFDNSTHNNVWVFAGTHGTSFGASSVSLGTGLKNRVITEDTDSLMSIILAAAARSGRLSGKPGDDGEEGEQGPPGTPGKRGTTGATGGTGGTGATGARGKRGLSAPPPDDPDDPEPGPPGRTGKTGARGATGAPGPSGSGKKVAQTPPPDDSDPFMDSPFGFDPQLIVPVSPRALVITGMICMWGGATAPKGWALCDGSVYNRSEPLFQIIGTTYGVGNGSTTANLPDMREAFPLGKGGTHALGATGGATTHSHGVGTLVNASSALSGITGSNSTSSVPGSGLFAEIFIGGASQLFMNRLATAAWTDTIQGGVGSQSAESVSRSNGAQIGGTATAAAQTWTSGGTGTAAAQTISGSTANATGPIDPFVTVNYIIKL